MTEQHETREIETTGKSECITSVSVTIYPRCIVALSDADHITQYQMDKALEREFPEHVFYFNAYGGKYTRRADAARFPNDGV